MIKLHEVRHEAPDREVWLRPGSISMIRLIHYSHDQQVTEVRCDGFGIHIRETPEQIRQAIYSGAWE